MLLEGADSGQFGNLRSALYLPPTHCTCHSAVPTRCIWIAKPVPEAGTIYYGSKYDYGLREDFKLFEWLVAEGYPQAEIDECGDTFVSRFWTVERDT